MDRVNGTGQSRQVGRKGQLDHVSLDKTERRGWPDMSARTGLGQGTADRTTVAGQLAQESRGTIIKKDSWDMSAWTGFLKSQPGPIRLNRQRGQDGQDMTARL